MEFDAVTIVRGETSKLSVTFEGSAANAALGGVSGLLVEIIQGATVPVATYAVQPSGIAGAITPSKLSAQNCAFAVLQTMSIAINRTSLQVKSSALVQDMKSEADRGVASGAFAAAATTLWAQI